MADTETSQAVGTHKEQSLLELIRQKLIVIDCNVKKEKRIKQELILEHKSSFPAKLRPAIDAAALQTQPELFLSEVYQAVNSFILGRFTQRNDRLLRTVDWHGVDSDVDTEEQVELAIRLFPRVLSFVLETPFGDFQPIHFLMTCAKAAAFIPLFAQLGVEAEAGPEDYSLRRIAFFLLTNSMSLPDEEASEFFGKAIHEEFLGFDERALSILIRLRERGLVKNEDVGELLPWLLTTANCPTTATCHESLFVEKRIRLLLGWNPSVLRACGKECRSIIQLFYATHVISEKVQNECRILRIFEILFELGMYHFPKELGFAFHCSIQDPLHVSDGDFYNFARKYGVEKVSKIVYGTIVNSLGPNNTLKSLIFAAASNDRISLGGLYTLLRIYPIELIKVTSTDGNRNQKKRKLVAEQQTTKQSIS